MTTTLLTSPKNWVMSINRIKHSQDYLLLLFSFYVITKYNKRIKTVKVSTIYNKGYQTFLKGEN